MIFSSDLLKQGLLLNSEKMHHFRFKAMGGNFSLSCYPQPYFSESQTDAIFAKGAKEVERIENLLTDFRPSAFNRINELAGERPVKVSSEILDLVQKGIELSGKTEGQFDLSYAPLGQLFRRAKETGHWPSEQEIKEAKELVDYRRIEVSQQDSMIFLPQRGMRIGLGGIGKGYAVDRCYEILKREGLVNFLVNGQGDVRFHSHPSAPRNWRVGIQNPLSPDPKRAIGLVQLKQGAVASSGDYKNYLQKKEQRYHHVFNPKTGRSSDSFVGITLVTEKTVDADSWATSLMAMNERNALKCANVHNLMAVFVDARGAVKTSDKALERFGIKR